MNEDIFRFLYSVQQAPDISRRDADIAIYTTGDILKHLTHLIAQ